MYTEKDAMPVMIDFLSALEFLHRHLIIHRDLKPANLVFDSKNDDAKLIIVDFGLSAKLDNPSDTLTRACGSPGYVSPELIRSEGYNFPTDMFSAGIIFAEMLTGRPVFKGSNPKSKLDKVA